MVGELLKETSVMSYTHFLNKILNPPLILDPSLLGSPLKTVIFDPPLSKFLEKPISP